MYMIEISILHFCLLLRFATHVQGIAGPAKTDPIVGYSDFYGHPNASDAIWHDETWAFSSHGPISKMALYKAWFYDGSW